MRFGVKRCQAILCRRILGNLLAGVSKLSSRLTKRTSLPVLKSITLSHSCSAKRFCIFRLTTADVWPASSRLPEHRINFDYVPILETSEEITHASYSAAYLILVGVEKLYSYRFRGKKLISHPNLAGIKKTQACGKKLSFFFDRMALVSKIKCFFFLECFWVLPEKESCFMVWRRLC